MECHGRGEVARAGTPSFSSAQEHHVKLHSYHVTCSFLLASLCYYSPCGDPSPNELMLSHFMHNLPKCWTKICGETPYLLHRYSGLWGNPFLPQGTLSVLHLITPANTQIHLACSSPLFTSQFRYLLLLPKKLLWIPSPQISAYRLKSTRNKTIFFCKSTHIILYIPFTVLWKFSLINLKFSVFTQLFLQVIGRNTMLRCQEWSEWVWNICYLGSLSLLTSCFYNIHIPTWPEVSWEDDSWVAP